jgi:two-component system, cell cycle response regulator DivK
MKRRILVIEDHEDNRRIMRDVLISGGYEVIEAVNGAEGVEKAAIGKPDLILMDLQLPVLDGLEATRRIKAQPDMRKTPVIAVTSYALNDDNQKAFAAGCDGYFSKPISPRQLLATVGDILAKLGA